MNEDLVKKKKSNGNSSPLCPSGRSHHIRYVNFPPSPRRLSRKFHLYVVSSPPPPYIRTKFYVVSSPPLAVAKNSRRHNFGWKNI